MSTTNTITYERFRGIEGAVIAQVTEDIETGITYGEVRPLMGAQQISSETSKSIETFFCDNSARSSDISTGETTIKITGAIPSLEVEALVDGQRYDSTNNAIIGTPRVLRYFALGYRYKLTNGEEVFVWNYKGTFALGTKTHKTEDNSTGAEMVELTFTGIDTTAKFDVPKADGTEGTEKSVVRNYIIKASKTVTAENFFATVITPDKVSELGA